MGMIRARIDHNTHMHKPHQRYLVWLLPAMVLLIASTASAQATPTSHQNPKLDAAIATLRHIDESKMSRAQKEKMSGEIDAAWETLRQAGPEGGARIKQEVQAVDANKQPDDFFKLNASALLWIIGKLDQAEAIAAIWNSTPLTAQYNYVFYTAVEAAKTQDPRAVPMLVATLRDHDGHTYIPAHDLTIGWPLAQQFVWGVYGAKGLPVLDELLRTSKDEATRRSAIQLLTDSYYLKALPAIREIATNGKGDERFQAIRALGLYGHPQDYDFLVSGLKGADPELAFHHVYALYEYDDLRAVPLLVPLLAVPDEKLQFEVVPALLHLASPASFDALHDYCGKVKKDEMQDFCLNRVQGLLQEHGLDWAKYAKLTPAAKEKLFFEVRRQEEAEYLPQKGDQALTRAQLVEVTAEWKSLHRAFTHEKVRMERPDPAKPEQFVAKMVRYYWVEKRHVLAVATPEDADLLIDARGAVYQRLSDECLYEVERINDVLRRLARRQYRTEVGLTEKAAAE